MCEKEQNYTISNLLLALGLCPIILILAFFAFVFFGITNVNAETISSTLGFSGGCVGDSYGCVTSFTGQANNLKIPVPVLNGSDYYIKFINNDVSGTFNKNTYELVIDYDLFIYDFVNSGFEYYFPKWNIYANGVEVSQKNISNVETNFRIEMVDNIPLIVSTIQYKSTFTLSGNSSLILQMTPHNKCSSLRCSVSKDNDFYFSMLKSTLFYTDITESNKDITDSLQSSTDTIIANQNQNKQDIIDSIQGDGLENNKPTDNTNFDNYEDAESGLMNEDNLNAINDIDISIDSNSSDFIWTLVTRILNTHALVFGAVITCLSLGIIKLILNR